MINGEISESVTRLSSPPCSETGDSVKSGACEEAGEGVEEEVGLGLPDGSASGGTSRVA